MSLFGGVLRHRKRRWRRVPKRIRLWWRRWLA